MVRRGLFGVGLACALSLGSNAAFAGQDSLISEIRLGALAHDQGIFSGHKESGTDINVELLGPSLGWLGHTVALRPHIGGTVNSAGNTSDGYFGLTATVPIWHIFFFEGSVGGAVHTGNLDANEPGHKDLGCRVLFRESLSLGAFIGDHITVSMMADHISNANICGRNEGLEAVGGRVGYRF
jgi:lipid A 3-O-deacylase